MFVFRVANLIIFNKYQTISPLFFKLSQILLQNSFCNELLYLFTNHKTNLSKFINMEHEQATAKKFVLNYGLLLGIVSVIFGVIMYVMNAHLDPGMIYTIIGFLVLIVIISLAIKAFKSENGGFLSLGEALKVGIGVAVIGGIIAALWSFVLMNYIEPDYMSQLMEVQREKMIEAQPEMTQAQLDATAEMTAKFSSPLMVMAFSLIGNLFFGLVISLIAGLIMKNKNPYQA